MPSILLVTALYPPSRQIGGRRVHRFAKGLRDRGWTVTVLCPKPPYMAPLDQQGPADPGIEMLHTDALVPRVWMRNRVGAPPQTPGPGQPAAVSLRSVLKRTVGQALALTEFPDELAGWMLPAMLAVVGRRFDVVLASAPPHTTLLLGAQVAQLTGAKLVLDYRDPWSELMSSDGSYGHERSFGPWLCQLHQWTEDRVLGRAQLVLGVTPQICRWLQPRTRAPIQFLPNSLDSAPPDPPLPRDRPQRLVYAGSLAYERSLGSVLTALAVLREPLGPDQVRLTYAGPHGDRLRHSAEALGVADYLDDHGVLGHAASLALYRGAAAGIVSVSARTDYSYPGKLFEVLAAGCPILLVGPAQCEAAKLVRELGAGVVDDGLDLASSVQTLRALLLREPGRPVGLENWLAGVQVGKLDGLLRGLGNGVWNATL